MTACVEGLPRFMVPADVMHVQEWPLTATGKIDYNAVVARASKALLGITNEHETQHDVSPATTLGPSSTVDLSTGLSSDGVTALARADIAKPLGFEGVTLADSAEAEVLCDADVAGDWESGDQHDQDDFCIDQSVLAQAVRTPTDTAIVHGKATLSYGELQRRVRAVSAALTTLYGVRHGDRVGVFATRSPDMVVAMLAVMNAGAAYVPIDPSHPERRSSMICDDAGIGLLLRTRDVTDTGGFLSASAAKGMTVVVVEDLVPDVGVPDSESIPPDPTDAVACDGAAVSVQHPAHAHVRAVTDIAVVLFTSGSTGRPKGVELPHRAIVSIVEWMSHAFELNTPSVRAHAFTSCVMSILQLRSDVAFAFILSFICFFFLFLWHDSKICNLLFAFFLFIGIMFACFAGAIPAEYDIDV